jgi:hypothetical protein
MCFGLGDIRVIAIANDGAQVLFGVATSSAAGRSARWWSRGPKTGLPQSCRPKGKLIGRRDSGLHLSLGS